MNKTATGQLAFPKFISTSEWLSYRELGHEMASWVLPPLFNLLGNLSSRVGVADSQLENKAFVFVRVSTREFSIPDESKHSVQQGSLFADVCQYRKPAGRIYEQMDSLINGTVKRCQKWFPIRLMLFLLRQSVCPSPVIFEPRIWLFLSMKSPQLIS